MNSISKLSDEELIAATREGDDDAYAELYLRHRSVAKGVAVQIGANQDDADDFVAEAFAATLRKLRSGGGPDVFFRGYILGTVRNLANRNFGKAAKIELVAEYSGDAERAVEDDPAGRYESEIVRAAFDSLPERAKMVLWLTEVEDKKPQEISEMMGLSANAIAALAYRSRETLRQAYLQNHLQQTPEPGCRKYANQLGALIRQKLPTARSRQVRSHVRTCIYCTTAMHDIADVNSSLRRVIGPSIVGTSAAGLFPTALGEPAAMASADAAVDAATAEATTNAGNADNSAKSSNASNDANRRWWWIGAAALLLLLTVGLWFGLQPSDRVKATGPEPTDTGTSPAPTPSPTSNPTEPASASPTATPTPSSSPVAPPPRTSPVPPPVPPVLPPPAINTLTPSGSFSSDQFDPSSSALKIGLTPSGDGPLNNVRVEVRLPAGMSFDYADAGPNGWQCAASGQTVSCSGSPDSSGTSFLRLGLRTDAAGSYPVSISTSGTGWGPASTSATLNRP